MQMALKIFVGVLILFLMVAIRTYEGTLFYDPLLSFFKTNHTVLPLPEMHIPKLIAFTMLRFLMNTILSLALLWVVFKKRMVIKLSIVLYAMLFACLLILFIILLCIDTEAPHRILFYVRRFLIQPLFLLVLLPAFYFQGLKK
ncbi:MAG: exosortase F-associated protein [Patiriisocius sp.]|jgi:exosortase F-associated protein